ncbi:phage major capsid protein, partial [Escherichia coli]
RSGA